MTKGKEPVKAGKTRPKKSVPESSESGPTLNGGTPEEQLAGFLAKFTPEVAAQAEAALAKMRTLLPGAVEMVYDNYNALAIGFGETEKASQAPFSIAVFPRRPSLCFLRHGAVLPDPEGILQGGGNQVRSVPVVEVEVLDRPAVRTLIDQALELAGWTPQPKAKGRMVIKSISAKQRPRRPAGK